MTIVSGNNTMKVLFFLMLSIQNTVGFTASTTRLTSFGRTTTTRTTLSAAAIDNNDVISPILDIDENFKNIQDEAYIEAAKKLQTLSVPVSSSVSETESVDVTYVEWSASNNKKNAPTVILLHGFDSSCLEFRRLGPKLLDKSMNVIAVDVLGWGFTQLKGVNDFGVDAKVESLVSFCNKMVNDLGFNGNDVYIAGASLGGAVAMDLTLEFSKKSKSNNNNKINVRGLILLDAQGFVDGTQMTLPDVFARWGVKVLKSVPLRQYANQISYYDPKTFATDDAVAIGRLHCVRDGWEDAMISFMKSGGFAPSEKVAQMDLPTLVLWGRQDKVLDGAEFANKFIEVLPNGKLEWIEECGHVPHLEQAEQTATVIDEFVQEQQEEVRGSMQKVLIGVGGAVAAIFGTAATQL